MRLHLLSDLHLETGEYRLPDGLECDVIAAVGDIAPSTTGVEFLKTLPHPVIYVPGNHEFWLMSSATGDGGKEQAREDYAKRLLRIRAAAAGSNVHVLDCDTIVIGGVRFLGATLWTNYGNGHPTLMRVALQRMRDYYKIGASHYYATKSQREAARHFLARVGCDPDAIARWVTEKNFLPLHAHALHRRAMRFLRRELTKPFAGETVILTHHAPTFDALRRTGLASRYFERRAWADIAIYTKDNPLYRVAAYASDLDSLLTQYRERIDLWCFGHIHHALDFVHKGVRLVSNPRGYYHGPLTAKNAEAFRVYGIDITEEHIARRQAYFRTHPYMGDGTGFERGFIIDTEAGLVPPLARLIDKTFEVVHRFKEEFEQFAAHVQHPDTAIRKACQEVAVERATRITDTLRPIALEVLKAIGLVDSYDKDGNWALALADLDVLKPNRGWSFEPLGGGHDPKHVRQVLANIRKTFASTERTMRKLPELPQLAHRISRKALLTIMREARSQGLESMVRGWATRQRVRRFPSHLVAELRFEAVRIDAFRKPQRSESRQEEARDDTEHAFDVSIRARFNELVVNHQEDWDWRQQLRISVFDDGEASTEGADGWMTLAEFEGH